MVIQIITLNPNSPNVQELMKQLREQGLEAGYHIGVDGRNGMPDLQPDESINQKRSMQMRLVGLTSTEVGCYLSHLRAIKDAYQQGIQQLCLLEDDVLLEESFGAILSKIAELPEKAEFVRLMGLKKHKRKLVSRLDETHQLTRPVKGLCGTQGYVINRAGMEKVLARGKDITEPIDKFFDHYWDIPLKSYCVEPHVIWERPRKPTTSSISKESRINASRPLGKRIRKHQIKLMRGTRRRFYMLKHLGDFSPATRPTQKTGRTERIH